MQAGKGLGNLICPFISVLIAANCTRAPRILHFIYISKPAGREKNLGQQLGIASMTCLSCKLYMYMMACIPSWHLDKKLYAHTCSSFW
jgi:hypothetical protein